MFDLLGAQVATCSFLRWTDPRLTDVSGGKLMLIAEATFADVISDAELWVRCSKDTIVSHGYTFSDQSQLVALFLSRRLKTASGPEEAASRLIKMCADKPDEMEVEEKTHKAFWKCLSQVCAPTESSVEDLESALELLKTDDKNEILQVFVNMSAGRVLQKSAEQLLGKRKESASVAKRMIEMFANGKRTLEIEDPLQSLRGYSNFVTSASR